MGELKLALKGVRSLASTLACYHDVKKQIQVDLGFSKFWLNKVFD